MIFLYYNIVIYSGRGAVWLARMTGGHEVAGSSPVAPIFITLADIRVCRTATTPVPSLFSWFWACCNEIAA